MDMAASPLESIEITNGYAKMIFNQAVTYDHAELGLVASGGTTPLGVTPVLSDDGKSLTFSSGSITANSALSFAGSVNAAGEAFGFDFVGATSLTGVRTAVTAAKMAFSVSTGNEIAIQGSEAVFGDGNDAINLLSTANYTIKNPVIDLGAGDDKVSVGSGSVLSSHSGTAIDAGAGHDMLSLNTQSFSLLFGIRGNLFLDNYQFSNFEEVKLPCCTLLDKSLFGKNLTLNLGTKNAFDTLSFGSNVISDYNPDGDMAVVSGSATEVTINGMADHTTVNFNGGVAVETTAFTMKGARELDVKFDTDNAVDMAFGKLTLPNAETLNITVENNSVANAVSVSDLNVTNLRTLKLDGPDADDSASIVLNGSVAANSLLDFSTFNGSVTLTDNAGATTVSLASSHGNVITLKADNAANVVSYAAAGGGNDAITNFEVAHDTLRFDASLENSVRFATATDGITTVYLDADGDGQFDDGETSLVALTGTAGFSADNISFA